MKILSLDPGAKRVGWAVIEGDGQTAPIYHASGVIHCEAGKTEKTQAYRLRLERHWTIVAPKLLLDNDPDEVVNEILPSTGFNNAVQAYLANCALAVFHAAVIEREIPLSQISSSTVQANIGRKRGATKVKVRNGVCDILPELAPRKFQWTKIFEEPDAIGIALAKLGYSLKESK